MKFLESIAWSLTRSENLNRLFAVALVVGLALAALFSYSLILLPVSAYTTTGTGQVTVTGTTLPNPQIVFSVSQLSVGWGNTFEITLAITNTGGTANWQTAHVAFPSISCSSVSACTTGACTILVATPCVQILSCSMSGPCIVYPTGSIFNAGYGSGTITSTYLVVEGAQAPMSTGQSGVSMKVRVTPNVAGNFYFHWKTVASGGAWSPTSGTLDQQNEYVYVTSEIVTFAYNMGAPPQFAVSIAPGQSQQVSIGITNSNPSGGSMTVDTFSVVNNGGCPCTVTPSGLPMTIPGGTVRTFTLSIAVPSGAAGGVYTISFRVSGLPPVQT